MTTPHRPAAGFSRRLLPLSIAFASPWLAAQEAEPLTLEAVRVSGEQPSSYQSSSASVGGFNEAPLLDTPASISVFSEERLKNQQAKLLSDVLRNDASVGDSYAPVGYYENFVVRGFSLNAANSYRINGRSITGEQNVALENKEQVELLKGLSGLQSGVSEPAAWSITRPNARKTCAR